MKNKKEILIMFSVLSILLSGCNDKETHKTESNSQAQDVNNVQIQEDKKLSYHDSIIQSSSEKPLRDPFVLLHNGSYYIYGTGWTVCKTDDIRKIDAGVPCVEEPDDFVENKWAPEVYFYNHKFYMITTYRSNKSGRRGCAIFVSDTPDGQFKLHSNGHITPENWDAIDGTLYIDDEGQPWMVFVHEWVTTEDNVGRMACAKLSDDLTELISEPIELFRADDALWDNGHFTDGCFIYKAENGALNMIWSNNDIYGYCVGIATSESGDIEGPWIQQKEPLYSKKLTQEFDGGHGMIFTDKYGYMWMSIHSPNNATANRSSIPVFVPIKEENNNLVWDTTERAHYKKD